MKENFLKKLVAAVLTTAVVFSSIAFPSVEAKADTSSVWVYGTFNNWAGTELTSDDGITYTGDVSLLAEADNLYIESEKGNYNTCVSISIVVSDDIDNKSVWTDADNGNVNKIWVKTDAAGTYTMTYDSSTSVVTLAVKSVSTTTYTYEYYVTGADEFEAESWSNEDGDSFGDAGKMIDNEDGTWTYTTHTSKDFDGSAGYTIKKLGVADDESGNTITDVKWFQNCNYSGAGILTIIYDVDAWEATVTFVEDSIVTTIGAQTKDTDYSVLGFVTIISKTDFDAKKENIAEMGILVKNSANPTTDAMVVENASETGDIRKIVTNWLTDVVTLDSSVTTADTYAFRSVITGISDGDKTYTAVPYITYTDGTTEYGNEITRSVNAVK